MKQPDILQLSAIYLPDGFAIDEMAEQTDGIIKTWTEAFETDRYSALFHFGFLNNEKWFSPSIEFLHHIAEKVISKLCRLPDIELNREDSIISLTSEEIHQLLQELPFAIGMEYVDEDWLIAVSEAILNVFRMEIKSFDGTVSRFFIEYNSNINVAGRVFFHLVENRNEGYPFAFMATYSTKPVKSKKAVHTPLKNALKEFDGDEKALLSLIAAVIKAAEKSEFISDLLESGELFSPLKLSAEEAYIVLKEIPVYEEAGIMCRVPDWWQKRNHSLRMSVSVGEKEPSKVSLDAILKFSPSLYLGDDLIREDELKSFLSMAEGLILYKGKWVEINKKKLEAVLQAFEKIRGASDEEGLSLLEAMRLELNMNKLMDTSMEELDISVTNGEWFRRMKESLVTPEGPLQTAIEPSFKAILRVYQEKGYQWLNRMADYRFGACLADDMGLGKTVQVIAFLEHRRIKYKSQALLILPASLIGNWQKEIERFAPLMTYQILHKSSVKSTETIQIKEGVFLCITTYGMAGRLEELKNRQWDWLVLDEAQAIKNAGTKKSKAIKSIPAVMRIAMTGTPIENRLSDLWSLFDFLNRGLLGTPKEFTDFTRDLSLNASGYARLRNMIQPFILRRLKTDKSIIADLPEKMEMNAYTTLSKEQVALYKQLIEQISEKLDEVEGIERKGLVLASIMKFKQICNHPDQYLGREEFKPEQSGKFEQLREICETIYEKRERVLVFTQFREMTEPIADFLKSIFLREGFVLHGGTPVKKRSDMVTRFNGEHYIPYMVLSLKAGGVGLNLTGASHVIHFDRWWNPAVENQATDRAFRIGQQKNVMVHKFVTKGTIEEKIDEIIEGKKQLAGDILSTGNEQWLTEYSNKELLEIFALEVR
ncbi:MAG: DEAD/DEAH box helicase [Clostridia bacterium]|nr:DEAD/DEAH box helicase [Clostridia bacterium]